jgi:hypothetical protein
MPKSVGILCSVMEPDKQGLSRYCKGGCQRTAICVKGMASSVTGMASSVTGCQEVSRKITGRQELSRGSNGCHGIAVGVTVGKGCLGES